jgi:hypothetical protein
MKFMFNDGGRSEAGFRGTTGDCTTRSIAIATEKSYIEVYNALNEIAKTEKPNRQGKVSDARLGVFRSTTDKYLSSIGWKWVPTMLIGKGCQVHLREDELPKGRLIVRVSKHVTAVIDGIIHDTYDCSRNGGRCVYGYYAKK